MHVCLLLPVMQHNDRTCHASRSRSFKKHYGMFEKEMDAKNDNAVIKNSSTQHKKSLFTFKRKERATFFVGGDSQKTCKFVLTLD